MLAGDSGEAYQNWRRGGGRRRAMGWAGQASERSHRLRLGGTDELHREGGPSASESVTFVVNINEIS